MIWYVNHVADLYHCQINIVKSVKGKTSEVYQMDILNSFDTEEIRELLFRPHNKINFSK